MKWLCVLLLLLPSPLLAGVTDTGSFARIPVLHEGRIKPLGSFAQATLRTLSGETTLEGGSATAWLAGVLLAPSVASEQPVLRLKSAKLAHLLGLEESQDGLYSFTMLGMAITRHEALIRPLLAKDRKTTTPDEQALVDAYRGVELFATLAGSLAPLLPVGDVDAATRDALGLPASGDVTLLDLMKREERMDAQLKATVAKKGDAIEHYLPAEKGMALLSYRLHLARTMDKDNSLLRVIPPLWEGEKEWLAPWAVINKGEGSPEGAALFGHWQALGAAWRDGDGEVFRSHSDALLAAGLAGAGARPLAVECEFLYNRFDLPGASFALYVIAFTLALAALFRGAGWASAAYGALGAGATLHAVALMMRMFILLRPPVATLYESMIFVSFIAAVFGLWLERGRRGADGLLISSCIAALLLMAARVFGAGDTLEVLVAVLNTRFWLATHVVCITMGYGTALVAGALAHLYLLRCATKAGGLAALGKRLYRIALVALLFTTVGTMLGGIWADQSWGRFWGWDPKENGALLIVLWLIWTLHGRVAGQLSERCFAVAMAFITIVVALAWVGVNLLSVGLHSYGFTDSAADLLLAFCAGECLIIGLLWLLSLRASPHIRQAQAASPPAE